MVKQNTKVRRRLLLLSIFLNILLLVYFKYSNFFIDNLNSLLNAFNFHELSWTKVVLPIGISFITFHKISFIIDTYRDNSKTIVSFNNYLLYILMFPHQIAGPIVRYDEISSQINDRDENDTIDFKLSGLFRFIIGLSKKVIIANPLGDFVNGVFLLEVDTISSTTAWITILAYTFQIYFDFSGYSDMAIGLAKMMGFTFPENFKSPYLSLNITEFWKRWHITLGSFMREYLYIPLGGNRVSKFRLLINLWIVFLISGIWHGAEWTFVIWGVYHGFLLIIDRLILLKIMRYIPKGFNMIITFLLVTIGWVFFRSPNINYSLQYVKKLFVSDQIDFTQPLQEERFKVIFIISILICLLPLLNINFKKIIEKFPIGGLVVKSSILLVLLLITISEICGSGFNPFIYFRF
ncbi:MAG: MBOAT family protein [Bacteroidia bacterium]|nr:MBOAT family protein [Bacteroidia bacterium]